MNKYGVVAINAARLILDDGNIQPLTEWNSAASSLFGKGTSSKSGLWKEVMKGVQKKHNSLMDVVLALLNSKLIVEE
ncbi:hypothetical protein [Paenibacillus sp. FSL H8-0537]|uniref:DUF6979 family protein n=1 Tax=Paenibacillus sp. FSL H8-0537 TaxID=2921399 RepID=UPI00310142AD